jgi:hypothetical protein
MNVLRATAGPREEAMIYALSRHRVANELLNLTA